ncbi:MAG: glycosyltransferase, partial [Candidatus Paceibacterota bacterium]
MKILMISNDRGIVSADSDVQKRMVAYGKLVRELHIVLFSTKAHAVRGGRISENVFVYPTHSFSRLFFILDAIRIGKKIKAPSLITTQDPYETGVVGMHLARKHKTKFQAQLHTDIWSPYFLQSFLDRVRQFLAKKTLKKAHCIRVVSERIRRSLIERGYTAPIEVLPIFSDIESNMLRAEALKERKKTYPFPFTILMAGRLEKEKNYVLALSVLKEVREKGIDAGLVIAGKGSQKGTLTRKAHTLGIREHVRFVGHVDDMLPYFQNAHILLHTSWYEGYGLTLIEAASAGLPIVTTEVGIAGKLLSHGTHALLCKPGDSSCLTEQIAFVAEDKELGGNLAFNAKTRMKEHKITKREYLERIKEGWERCG